MENLNRKMSKLIAFVSNFKLYLAFVVDISVIAWIMISATELCVDNVRSNRLRIRWKPSFKIIHIVFVIILARVCRVSILKSKFLNQFTLR